MSDKEYRGKWVAKKDGTIIASGNTATEVVLVLRTNSIFADSLFLIPNADEELEDHFWLD